MTRLMCDSVNPYAIPANATMVAGYVNGPVSVWSAGGWERFPNAVKIRIDVGDPPAPMVSDVADVGDIGDYTPQTFASEFVTPRHAKGWWSCGYVSLSVFFGSLSLFQMQPDTVYWIADWNLSQAQAEGILAGLVPQGLPTTETWRVVLASDLKARIKAVQFASPSSNGLPGYDLSAVAPDWFPAKSAQLPAVASITVTVKMQDGTSFTYSH